MWRGVGLRIRMGLRSAGVTRLLLSFVMLAVLCAPAAPVLAVAEPRTPASTLAAPVAPADAFGVGTRAVVRSDGQGLRVRTTPSINGAVVTTLPENTQVTIVDGRVSADGYWWQRVQSGAVVGWVAELYLRAAAPTLVQASGGCPAAPGAASTPALAAVAAPTPAAPAPAKPTLFGTVPKAGFGLVVWAGGSTDSIVATAAEGGCALRSVWASSDNGDLLGYLVGAPAFVNRPWSERFTDGIPASTPLILVCGGSTSGSDQPSSPGAAVATASVLAAPEAAPTLAPAAVRSDIVPAAWGLAPVAVKALPPPTTQATSALVLDGSSGAVLYQKNGELPVAPASLTKIATAILAAEAGNLDQWVTVDVDSRQMDGSSVMGLVPGDCFRMRDLLYGLMLPSGNDAAVALGRQIAGSDAAFVGRMNDLVERLRLTDTHFANPHGLDAPGHVASAHDLALLARYAMTIPDFTSVVGASRWVAQGSRTIALTNTNAFLPTYPGADGVKTGFTDAAGRTLVASVTRNGRRVFVVVLNAPNRDADAKALFDWSFANFIWG
jgi:D-alanyl-D-alanine carboxypeptidase (penicillin-binding protein 5/6)